jgi:hypothetical protein
VAETLFRAGRVDAVWAVRTEDARQLVIKAHRQPVDLIARQATAIAQRLLTDAGFPCPYPVSGPDQFEGLVLTTETLMTTGTPAWCHYQNGPWPTPSRSSPESAPPPTPTTAASWVIAYNARCELSMLSHQSRSAPSLELARLHGNQYLELTW